MQPPHPVTPRATPKVAREGPGEHLMATEPLPSRNHRHRTTGSHQLPRGPNQPHPHRVRLRRLTGQLPQPPMQVEPRPVGPPRQGAQRDVLTQPRVDDGQEVQQFASARQHPVTVPTRRRPNLTILALPASGKLSDRSAALREGNPSKQHNPTENHCVETDLESTAANVGPTPGLGKLPKRPLVDDRTRDATDQQDNRPALHFLPLLGVQQPARSKPLGRLRPCLCSRAQAGRSRRRSQRGAGASPSPTACGDRRG